ncbi:MAG: histidine kinase [Halanaerobiales bacterium]|nr:histidine kinase [Halanaerobiales bacterium]
MRSIKSRLLFYIFLITIIPVTAFFIYTLVFVSSEQIESETDQNKTKLSWSTQYLNSVSDQLSDIVYSIQIQDDLLTKVEQSYAESDEIESILKDFLYANANLIRNIQIVSFRTNRSVEIDYESGFRSDALSSVDPIIQLTTDPIGFDYTMINQTLMVAHTINDFATQENLGLILIEVSDNVEDEITDIFGSDVGYALLTKDNRLLLNNTDLNNEQIQTNLSSLTPSTTITETEFEGKVAWGKSVPSSNLMLVSMIERTELRQVNNRLIQIGIVIIAISLLTTIPTAIFFSNRITSPITKLVDHMKDFEFTTPKQTYPKYDELNLLEESYNHMIKEVSTLIKEQFQYKLDRQDAQLKALQAQINPHFLSNTFQLIGGIALSIDAEDIYDATIKMSHLVRYSAHFEQNNATLKEELTHINDYLAIQKLRFGDRLKLTIDVKDKYNTIKLPKFTLQPLIENAFQHGLKTVSGQWRITIHCQEDDGLKLIIKDNGTGIYEDQLNAINAQFWTEENSLKALKERKDSIGLVNIDSRIKLLYGNNYGLSLVSDTTGLSVIITLPKEEIL